MAKKKKKMTKKKKKKETTTKRALGLVSKLGIIATWVMIFENNFKKHLTDERILSQMKLNFPEQAAKSKIFSSVKKHRSLYNRDVLTHGKKPKKKSVPYEKD